MMAIIVTVITTEICISFCGTELFDMKKQSDGSMVLKQLAPGRLFAIIGFVEFKLGGSQWLTKIC